MSGEGSQKSIGDVQGPNQPVQPFANLSVHEQGEETLSVSTTHIANGDEEKRRRTMSLKAMQNAIQAKTVELNAKEIALKSAIDNANNTLEKGIHLDVSAILEPLQLAYTKYNESLEELEGLYDQDKWGEFSDSSREMKEFGKFLLKYARTTLEAVVRRKRETSEEISSRKSRHTTHAPTHTSSRSRTQASSSSSARRKALVEAAAAKQQAEFDRIMAEKENTRVRQEAEEDLRRKCARAQHDRDMALLAADKAAAVADAKLKAIEQSIAEERMSVLLEGDDQQDARSRTQNWVNAYENTRYNAENTGDDMPRDNPPTPTAHTGTEVMNTQPLQTTKSSTKEQPPIRPTNQLRLSPRGFAGNPTIFKPSVPHETVSNRYVEVLETTNQRLATTLARQNLPKCHPDVFEGDPTLFHPWKKSFEAMIQDAYLNPAQEMAYLRNYTGGKVQILVDNFRKRQQTDPGNTLRELWLEIERRFGNVAVITNTLLEKLHVSAKFSGKDNVKLQRFADICADVENQISHLPGLACLNYASTIRPIVDNLPNYLRYKWEKQVVDYAEENNDDYPGFQEFASMIRKQAKLRNHPNVVAGETPERGSGPKKPERGREHSPTLKPDFTSRVLKTDLEAGDHNDGAETDQRSEKRCPFHERKGHELSECKAFGVKTLEEKTEWIRKSGLCFRCLAGKHRAKQCKEKVTCNKCKSNLHRTLLHKDKDTSDQASAKEAEERRDHGEELRSKCTSVCEGKAGGVSCSKIILVDVFAKNQPEKTVRVYALIDDQSNASMISPSLIKKLNANGPKEKYLLSTCSSSRETKYGRRISGLVARGLNEKSVELPTMIECEHIPQDKSEIPTPKMSESFPHLKEISSEIPPVDRDANIEILIGRDAPEVLKVRKFKNGPRGAPWAQKHILGWTISGEMCLDRVGGPVHISACRTAIEPSRHSKLHECSDSDTINCRPASEPIPCPNYFRVKEQHGWNTPDSQRMEDLFSTTPDDNETTMSWEDRRFLEIMEKGIHKNESGNWEMPLPFRSSEVIMPNNRNQALERLHSLQRTFRKKPQLEKDYVEFMGKIIERGHTFPVPQEEIDASNEEGKVWYLPHFGVYGSKKPGQIRVVFDSSCECDNVSLNKVLLPGPDMMNSLIGVLMRFRRENVGVVSDVEQMFHSFHVNLEHRDFLRFLWFRNNDTAQEVQEYRMNVHIFGNGPSPAVATFGLRRTALHGEEEFGSDVKEFVCRDFYVDDGLTSKKTEAEAIDLVKRAQTTLATANLRLHKIASNSVAVMEAFDVEDRAKDVKDLELRQDSLPSQRSLGVLWDLQSDTFTFKVCLQDKPFTRRGVLSVINSLYDPLGLAAPVILVGKLLLQQLIIMGKERESDCPLGWDDPLPEQLRRRWQSWREQLPELENIAVPRCYHPEDFDEVERAELHAFSDASKDAIGTAVFLRQVDRNKRVSVCMAFGQAKVAPIQPMSIPRLELCAAVLSAQAVSRIKKELDLKIDEVTYYTDSKVVLGYIKNEARRFHVYVANRVQLIRSMSEPIQWRYVSTSENPADLATRGATAKDLAQSTWLNGSPMLTQTTLGSATDGDDSVTISENDPEVRRRVTVHTTNSCQANGLGSSRFERFSSWSKLKSAIANLITKVRQYSRKDKHENRVAAERQAEQMIIKDIQAEHFTKEIRLLKARNAKEENRDDLTQRKGMLRKSNIRRLNPLLDQEGILRVGGRLHRSDLSFEERHPILLPKHHHVTQLIIRHFHQRIHHQGRLITQGEIRRAGYWVVNGHGQISKVLRRCVTCKRLRGKCLTQKMADLPVDRTETGAPFSNVGVDVFGPWIIKMRKLRGKSSEVKRWAVLFTCLASRAVHLEVLHSMDTSSFICALRRFLAIRGSVALIRCDCGTNFIGAQSALAQALNEMDHDRVEKYLRDQDCKWEFNPPHASHFGGVWERQIGTLRRVLDAMMLGIDSSQLDDELLATLMAEASSIVNNRPITVISSEIGEPVPLTPSMLLTLKKRPVLSPPGKFVAQDMYARRRWRRIQYLADQFWTRWKREYLQNLQQREKWIDKRRDLATGDVVLMKDADAPRNDWPLGIVREAIKSDDGKVRKARVEVFRGDKKRVFFRPIAELILLVGKDDDK